MSSRNMRLLPRATLHSDSEQVRRVWAGIQNEDSEPDLIQKSGAFSYLVL